MYVVKPKNISYYDYTFFNVNEFCALRSLYLNFIISIFVFFISSTMNKAITKFYIRSEHWRRLHMLSKCVLCSFTYHTDLDLHLLQIQIFSHRANHTADITLYRYFYLIKY
jgi:hypothetical protein